MSTPTRAPWNNIATRPIMDMCLAENRRPEPRVEMRWWK